MRQLAHRYVVTENCNASCKHCFNAEARDKGVMDVDLYLKFIRKNSAYLSQSTCLVMGGEPTIHPRIDEFILESAKHYMLVDVFTNGTRLHKLAKHPEIIREHFKEKVTYTINGYVFDPIKYLEYKDYTRYIYAHFVITKWGYKEMIEKIFECMKFHPYIRFTISSDTQVDVFNEKELEEYRKIWLYSIKKIIPVFQSNGIIWKKDHFLPICFFTQEMLDELNLIGLESFHFECSSCSCSDIGLIDWNFDLYYCNQTRIKIGSVLDDNGEPKSIADLVNIITPAHGLKTRCIKELRKECNDCDAVNTCRVGCYYNTLVKHCN